MYFQRKNLSARGVEFSVFNHLHSFQDFVCLFLPFNLPAFNFPKRFLSAKNTTKLLQKFAIAAKRALVCKATKIDVREHQDDQICCPF